MMNNAYTYFDSIDRIHSACSMMDKTTKLAYLKGQWNQLNSLAYQYGTFISSKNGITPEERQYAVKLLDMINTVEEEGKKTRRELGSEWMKAFVKMVMGR